MLKWDEGEHPRWPAGAADSKGGEFAPKDTGTDASFASQGYDWEAGEQQPRTELANTGMGVGGPILLAAAEIEDERDPRRDIGGNHPPLDELIPQQLSLTAGHIILRTHFNPTVFRTCASEISSSTLR